MANSIWHTTVTSILKDVGPSWPRLLSVQSGTRTHFTRLTLGWLSRWGFFELGFLVCLFGFLRFFYCRLSFLVLSAEVSNLPKKRSSKGLHVNFQMLQMPSSPGPALTSNWQLDLYTSKIFSFKFVKCEI